MIRVDLQPPLPGFTLVNPARCPHVIFSPEHYRADGRCRCDDPHHRMDRWGYRWDIRQRRWISPGDTGTTVGRRRRWWRRGR